MIWYFGIDWHTNSKIWDDIFWNMSSNIFDIILPSGPYLEVDILIKLWKVACYNISNFRPIKLSDWLKIFDRSWNSLLPNSAQADSILSPQIAKHCQSCKELSLLCETMTFFRKHMLSLFQLKMCMSFYALVIWSQNST